MSDEYQETLKRLTALSDRVTALRMAVGDLRDRLDAELKLTHNWLEGVEAKLSRLESRIDALEMRTYVPPEMMMVIERSSRETGQS